ncbi:MAG: preprotein translocase subunit SecE [Fibrobacterota bacterium]
MQKAVNYFKAVVEEMKKVTWPTREEVYSSTALVVVFSLILTLVVWGFDELVKFVVYNRVVG